MKPRSLPLPTITEDAPGILSAASSSSPANARGGFATTRSRVLAGIVLCFVLSAAQWPISRPRFVVIGGGEAQPSVPVVAAKRRVAVCFTGEARSFGLTAHSLRAKLLDPLQADGFVYVTIKEEAPSEKVTAALEALNRTGRVALAVVGPQERLYDQELSHKIKTSSATHTYIHTKDALMKGNVMEANRWLDKLAGQHLGRLACRDALLKHERLHRVTYDVFARVRIDTQFFQPVNRSILDAVDSPDIAVIPTNGDWGTLKHPGLCDKMLIGGRRAFGVDATVFKWVSHTPWKLKHVWSAEGLHREYMDDSKIRVLRKPLAYCTLGLQGQCKLGHELLDSIDLVPGLLEKCPDLCRGQYYKPGPCSKSRSVFVPPQVKESEPGLCRLKTACEKAWATVGNNKSQGVKICASYFHVGPGAFVA